MRVRIRKEYFPSRDDKKGKKRGKGGAVTSETIVSLDRA